MTTEPLRILLHSNAPFCGSGYGVQSKYLLNVFQTLREEGEPVEAFAMSCYFGLQVGRFDFGSLRMYGNPLNDPFGTHIVREWYDDFDANLLITLTDAWVLDPQLATHTRWAPYFPVDHQPIPPEVLGRINGAQFPITMSRFGQEEAKRGGIDAAYIPHMSAPEAFTPLPDTERDGIRQWMGVPEGTVLFGMVANNVGVPPRKCYAEVFSALRNLLDEGHDVTLWCHSIAAPGGLGANLLAIAQQFGVEDHVIFPELRAMFCEFTGEAQMNRLYNAFDALVMPSMGEGFGIPLIEAQMAGCPVIAQDVTAMSEVVKFGRLIPQGHPWLTPQNSIQWMPRIDDVTEAMRQVMFESRDDLTDGAREWCIESYSIANVTEDWRAFFRRVVEDVEPEAELQTTADLEAVGV